MWKREFDCKFKLLIGEESNWGIESRGIAILKSGVVEYLKAL